MAKGFVYLVGAGPGRADLITVRGAEALKRADCIIYDKLANPALLRFASADAEIIHVPKRTGGYARYYFKTDTLFNKNCKLFGTSAEDTRFAAL